jgi:hypothetical protein
MSADRVPAACQSTAVVFQTEPQNGASSKPGVRSRAAFVSAFLAAALAWFAFDALLFRTGIYSRISEPDSTTGSFELTLRRELQKQTGFGDNLIVTLGDSRFGYMPRVANELTPESGYVFRHAGVPGTNPEAWYYMLRDLDPSARRYRAIVFAVNDYDDEDVDFDPGLEPGPAQYHMDRLRLTDIAGFTRSFKTPALRWAAFRNSLLKGFTKQQDIHALLSHPLKRLADVKLYREGFDYWTYSYQGNPESMAGLRIDWKNWRATFGPQATAIQRETVNDVLMYKPEPQRGIVAAFRRKWFGRIIDRYSNSPTRIIFLRLARGPVPRPGLVRKLSSSIREFAARPNVLLADEHAFESLEKPELFQDAAHLNRPGSERFSVLLVHEISRLLGPPWSCHR